MHFFLEGRVEMAWRECREWAREPVCSPFPSSGDVQDVADDEFKPWRTCQRPADALPPLDNSFTLEVSGQGLMDSVGGSGVSVVWGAILASVHCNRCHTCTHHLNNNNKRPLTPKSTHHLEAL